MKYKKGDLVIWQHDGNHPIKMNAKVRGKSPDSRYPVSIEFTQNYAGYDKGDTLPAAEHELTLQSKLEKALQ